MDRASELWHRFWSQTWWIRALALAFATAVALMNVAAACEAGDAVEHDTTPTPTATATATQTPRPTATPRSTDTPVPTTTDTLEPTVTATPVNRMDCAEIRGTPYRSPEERTWFLDNCVTPVSTSREPDDNCHPSYPDVCLLPDAVDYDCAGGTGNGPLYVEGPITVLPPDPFGLDGNDNDGWGCENSPPPQQREPAPQQPPQTSNCDPSYPDVCIPIGAADYDCAGGSGNGPNYIQGPIRVLPPDPHGLDRDGDGIGCE